MEKATETNGNAEISSSGRGGGVNESGSEGNPEVSTSIGGGGGDVRRSEGIRR